MSGVPNFPGSPSPGLPSSVVVEEDLTHIWNLVLELTNPEKRETALLELR